MSFSDLNVIEIDLSAIAHNITQLKSCLLRLDTGIMPVVKSDGYGHGMVEVARVAVKSGATALAVFDVKEAVTLRKAGFDVPILLISGILPEDVEAVVAHGITVGVPDVKILNELEVVCKRIDKRAKVHLKIDTGMSRMGLTESELFFVLQNVSMWQHVAIEGLFSHMACADCIEHPLNAMQIERFNQACKAFEVHLGIKPFAHLANAAAAVLLPETQHDAIRPGIAIYGAYPVDANYLQNILQFKPAMSFCSRIVALREVESGASVSYGARFAATKPAKLAVVPVGYDCGYMRAMSGKAHALVRGRRCRVAGTICMRSMMLDVTDVPDVAVGDAVTLLGGDGQNRITIEEMASWAGTINYELLCLLGTRNKRVYKES